jgi:hypothetical protein
LNLDPRKKIIPTLHVETALINKFKEGVTVWMQLNVKYVSGSLCQDCCPVMKHGTTPQFIEGHIRTYIIKELFLKAP